MPPSTRARRHKEGRTGERLEGRYLGTVNDIVSVFLGTCMDLPECVKLTGF